MSIKSIAKKVWNSEAFETVVDVTFGVMECLGEALVETFSNNSHNSTCSSCMNYDSSDSDYYIKTYEYWNSLSPVDREYYFEHNETLQKYGELYYYNDKEQCAKSIAKIAKIERRSFDDKYDRY